MRYTSTSFSWRARKKSFVYAGVGIWHLLKTEHNAWIHLATTVLVAFASFYFKVSRMEMGLLFFAIALVWIAEMLNTCIEKTLDFITHKRCKEIKHIKDIAAGAVLIAALTALLIGAIVFIPKILSIWSII
ncbi:MAG TPA: diacylglycerol kinase family protein [Flavisolibacter sp.]|nr:diacylglycerol kinase family protein [Flavisolibacter sp.]